MIYSRGVSQISLGSTNSTKKQKILALDLNFATVCPLINIGNRLLEKSP